jgi:hypothetical protein
MKAAAEHLTPVTLELGGKRYDTHKMTGICQIADCFRELTKISAACCFVLKNLL